VSRIGTTTLRWLVLAAGCAAWQAWATWRNSPFFPPLSAIVMRMYHQWFSGPPAHLLLTRGAMENVLPSLGRVVAGLAIAVIVGLPLGIAIGRWQALSAYLEPLLHFARSLPAVALTTVFLTIFSLGTQSEVAFIAFGTTWPILVNTIDGARSLDPLQADTARAFHLPPGQRITKLIVPATMPKFFAGLRISVALALVLMVVSELVGGSNGIGYQMNYASGNLDMPGLWAGIVLIGIFGYALNAALLGVERHVLAWHRGARSPTN